MINKVLPQPKSRVLSAAKLKDHVDQGIINVEAPYQRDIVWHDSKKSELIDSIFNNYYIPPLVFAIRKVRNRNTRIVIDGKQRLTSIQRFMNNEIPYIDTSSGTPVPTYYIENPDEVDVYDKVYLDEDARDHFDDFNFVCIEYSNITEDDEFDIFSRVQLGVAITSAEKLKAHNTPVAKICRQLALDNSNLESILPKKGQANIFQTIAQMLLTIKNDKDEFKVLSRALVEFVASDYVPTSRLKESLKRVVETITALASDSKYSLVFSTSRGGKSPLKILELLVFAKYITSVQRNRTLKNYAEDFKGLREWIHDKKGGRIYIGKENFLIGMEYAEKLLEKHNLIAAARPEVFGISDSEDEDDEDQDAEDDELKLDEYEPETSPIPLSSTVSSPSSVYFTKQSPGKKRRIEKATKTTPGTTATLQAANRSHLAGKPTARRGGKAPSFNRR